MTRPHRVLYVALGLMVAMAFFDSLVSLRATLAGQASIAWALALGFCAFAWVVADARERKIEPPAGSALIAALIIPVGVPIYLFRALGVRRGFVSSLKAIGFMVIAVAAYAGVTLCIELLGWSAYVA